MLKKEKKCNHESCDTCSRYIKKKSVLCSAFYVINPQHTTAAEAEVCAEGNMARSEGYFNLLYFLFFSVVSHPSGLSVPQI